MLLLRFNASCCIKLGPILKLEIKVPKDPVIFPPEITLPATPMPPATTNAPDVIFADVAVDTTT